MKEKKFLDVVYDGYAVRFLDERIGMYTDAFCFPSFEACVAYIHKYMPDYPYFVEASIEQVEYRVRKFVVI